MAMKSLRVRNNRNEISLTPFNFTPADANLPAINNLSESAQIHKISPILDYRKQKLAQGAWKQSQQSENILDGFYLLEASGVSFPEDIVQITLSDKGLSKAELQDLTYFTNLLYADFSENKMNLLIFTAFPRLSELRLAYNEIQHIGGDLRGFYNLLYLDLSYNLLTLQSVQNLCALENLKDLNLCGNNLHTLPENMHEFQSIEKLSLEYNKLDDNYIFNILSEMPNLREIGLSNNCLSMIPEDIREGFKLLEFLDISFNYFLKYVGIFTRVAEIGKS